MTDDFPRDRLRERFRWLWSRCCAPNAKSAGEPVYEELARRYAEPARAYHGWSHLLNCLQQLDLAAALLDDPDAVEMALWFHDAVYEPGAPDNERNSADLFVSLAGRHFPPEFVDRVYELVLLTMHRETPDDRDQRFMVDIDLSSLALDWDTFLRDSINIREENRHLTDEVFYDRQAGFLQSLLARRRIFHSEFFFERYERAARANIARLLARLGSQGPG